MFDRMNASNGPRQATRSRKRRFQFTAAGLLVFVSALGCVFGWFGSKLWEARRQHSAVEQLRQLGGHVIYDFQVADRDGSEPLLLNADASTVHDRWPGPLWMRRWFGDDVLANVVVLDLSPPGSWWPNCFSFRKDYPQFIGELPRLQYLNLRNTLVTDEALAELASAGIPHLESINVCQCKRITDAGVARIAMFPRLRSIDVSSTGITDAALADLARVNPLLRLDVGLTKITDAGVAHLAELNSLAELTLYNTHVSDAGVRSLGQPKRMRIIDLSGSEITDDGLAEIALWPAVETLCVANTRITDAGLAHLQACRKLNSLDLVGTNVTNDGLALLQLIKTLKNVDAYGTSVDRNGVLSLQRAIPGVVVNYSYENDQKK